MERGGMQASIGLASNPVGNRTSLYGLEPLRRARKRSKEISAFA
jgi:hypothetical protein